MDAGGDRGQGGELVIVPADGHDGATAVSFIR